MSVYCRRTTRRRLCVCSHGIANLNHCPMIGEGLIVVLIFGFFKTKTKRKNPYGPRRWPDKSEKDRKNYTIKFPYNKLSFNKLFLRTMTFIVGHG